MYRSGVVSICVLLVVGCGAAMPPGETRRAAHLASGERYAMATNAAYRAHEREAEQVSAAVAAN